MAKYWSSSSSVSWVFCKICMMTVKAAEMFRNNNCNHAFCRSCLSRYIDVKVQEKCFSTAAVKCPEIGCKGVLEPEFCKHFLPPAVFVRWADVLCELMLPPSQRLYCPYKDCSELILNDSSERLRQSECPHCRRLFCAECKVKWHYGTSCKEFRRFGKGIDRETEEDLLLLKIAKDKKWRRCPSCKYFVEKRGGCFHITCRCGFNFCYGCGMEYSSSQHSACSCSL